MQPGATSLYKRPMRRGMFDRGTPGRRKLLIAGGVVVALFVVVVVGLAVVYPRVAVHMVRARVDRLAARLDRKIELGAIDVSLGHLTVRDLSVRGPHDGDLPLLHVARIDVDFATLPSLFGTLVLGEAKLDGVTATLRRDVSGTDNLRDAIAHYQAASGSGSSSGHSPRPTKVTISHVRVLANDEQSGATALVGDGDAVWTPTLVVAHGKAITATTTGAPKANIAAVEVRRASGQPPVVKVEGGELELWPRMALSGIAGSITADPDQPGIYKLDLAGGYGGVPGQLWTAKGALDPRAATGHVDLEAAKFQLDRLAPILAQSAVVDYQATAIDTKIHIDITKTGAAFDGGFHLTGLNIGHPYIADKEVHDLDLSGQITGSFDRATRKLELSRGDFVARNVPFSITGSALAPRDVQLDLEHPAKNADGTERTPPMRGPHGLEQVEARLVIPPIDCQRMIDAFPVEMVPYMHGYKIRGVFDVDIHTRIDWMDLDSLELGGHIAINKCRVVDEPADSPKRLKDEFEQYVETEKGEWESFVVGPSNPDFVPIDQISPYLTKSIQSSEDFAFYKHHGFIPTEFRTALINNLKREKFVQGASSITMQMVKNVLLFREKTLARKLQELFLTWHVENTLAKDRIFEIYLNVIEFGPDLYGIGPATKYYFGKPPKDLNPVEAAFFSTILPSPKDRSSQYCKNVVTAWTKTKIEHILANELHRKQLTQEEYDKAIVTPLLFYKTDDAKSEEDCMKRVKKAIKNARPTNPLRDREDDKQRDKTPGPRHHKKHEHPAE
jgi:hypothetical protein